MTISSLWNVLDGAITAVPKYAVQRVGIDRRFVSFTRFASEKLYHFGAPLGNKYAHQHFLARKEAVSYQSSLIHVPKVLEMARSTTELDGIHWIVARISMILAYPFLHVAEVFGHLVVGNGVALFKNHAIRKNNEEVDASIRRIDQAIQLGVKSCWTPSVLIGASWYFSGGGIKSVLGVAAILFAVSKITE